jgi:ParB-like chromosome segregation protein Spo0J
VTVQKKVIRFPTAAPTEDADAQLAELLASTTEATIERVIEDAAISGPHCERLLAELDRLRRKAKAWDELAQMAADPEWTEPEWMIPEMNASAERRGLPFPYPNLKEVP